MFKLSPLLLALALVLSVGSAGASSPGFATINTESGFGKLFALAADGHGNLYVDDQVYYTIDKISAAGHLLRRYPMPSNCGISGVAATNAGTVYAVPNCRSQVYRFLPSGRLIQKFGKQPNANGVAVDAQGHVYVAYAGTGPKSPPPGSKVKMFSNRFVEFSPTGQVLRTVALPGTSNAFGIAVGRGGNVYVSTQGALVEVSAAGRIVKRWPALRAATNGLPLQPAVDASGAVYALGPARSVTKISSAGTITSAFVKAGNAPADVENPTGLAVSGNHLFVADSRAIVIKEFTLQGKLVAELTS